MQDRKIAGALPQQAPGVPARSRIARCRPGEEYKCPGAREDVADGRCKPRGTDGRGDRRAGHRRRAGRRVGGARRARRQARGSSWSTRDISAPAARRRRPIPAPGSCRRAIGARRRSIGAGSAPAVWPTRAGSLRTLDMAWDRLQRLAEWGYPFPTRRRRQALYRQSARPRLHAFHAPPRAARRRHDPRPSSRTRTVERRRRIAGAGRHRPPARPGMADPGRRRRAGDRRLRLRRTHSRRHRPDRRRLSDGRGGRCRDVGHGVLGAIRLRAEAERAQQGAAIPLGQLHARGRHAARGPRAATATPLSPRRCSKGRSMRNTTRRDPELQDWLRQGQPNCFLPLDRSGVDPFAERWPVTLRCEGTVRGVGGIRLTGDDCATDVPGSMPPATRPAASA